MEENKYRITCTNHPDIDAVEKCVDCGKFYCLDCVSKIQDKYHCHKCQTILANITDTIGFTEKYNLRKFRIAVSGCLVLFIIGIITMAVLIIIPYLRLGTAIPCNRQLKQVYKTMFAYANDHDGLFPPENNNLIPLYATKYSKGIDLLKKLKCPGTENIVSIPAHLKDDSDARIGTGMSYFYQGGLNRSDDENELIPLLWDQSPENHKGRGINILYTNGSINFYKEDYPEVKDSD